MITLLQRSRVCGLRVITRKIAASGDTRFFHSTVVQERYFCGSRGIDHLIRRTQFYKNRSKPENRYFVGYTLLHLAQQFVWRVLMNSRS